MSVAIIVLKNVASSWVGLACQIVVTMLLTPFVIAKLGNEAYGLWLLLQGLVGYYGMVDMGLRAGLTQSITRRIAADDIPSVRRHIAAAIPLFLGLGVAVVAIAGLLAIALPRFVEISDNIVSVVLPVVLIQALGVAIKLPVTPYGAVLVGLQRYDIANAISIVTRVVFAVMTWQALKTGGGLVMLSLILTLTDFLDGFIRVVVARRLLPEIRRCGLTFDRSELNEIMHVGVWNFLVGISRQFIYFSDVIVVAILFSARAVAPYGLAASLVEYGTKIVVAATKVLFPTMTHMLKRGDKSALVDLYVTSTRIVLGLSLSLLVVGSTWIRPFLTLWLGDSEQSKELVSQAPLLYAVLSIAFIFVGLQRVGTQLMLADNKLKSLSLFLLAEAVFNLLASMIAGKILGPVGIAVGTLVAASLIGFVLHLPAHAVILEQRSLSLLGKIAFRPLAFAALLACTMIAMSRGLGPVSSWFDLAFAGTVSVFASVFLFPIMLSSAQISGLRTLIKIKISALLKRFPRPTQSF
ncbi:Polysaccharide biosynthesis protein [Rubripirellula reticaptiva]|uniref:Polysaccharide biosynthesis protein n=2 Tax=Rubripirellula reticaptiva TaxID=2528013 RepID=A0A5C6F588_9BACT|nr:Polysaccharide biosynthesis protein [Rubripirellula reticaptiva]